VTFVHYCRSAIDDVTVSIKQTLDLLVRNTDRFLITHTGSLPRPEDLIQIMFAKEESVRLDREALASKKFW